MNFLIAHWPIIAPVVLVVISEAMPFLPTKYDGIAQAVVGIIKGQNAPTS